MRNLLIWGWLLIVIFLSAPTLAQEVQPLFTIGQMESSTATSDWMAMSAEFNDRLLATVYWALGTVAGLVVLVVGVNWFTGQRAYDRDRAALETVLKGQMESGLAAIREETFRANTDARNEQIKSHQQLREELTNITASRSVELSQRLDEISAGAVAPLSIKAASMEQALKASIKATKGELESQVNYQIHRITMLEALSWMPARDVPGNAIRYYAEALEFSLENLGGMSDSHLLQTISDLLPRCVSLSGNDAATITSAINKASPEHSVAVAKIRDLLAKK